MKSGKILKLSDYVADFLSRQGIRHVFVISGGASLHLIDSISKHPAIDYVCPQHEQAGAMAADAYARITQNLGAAISTSGPGATNMLTGVCCAYYDSVPVLYITGQVTTFRLKRNTGVRQLGFQETDVVDIFKPITKYAVRIEDPLMIRYELEKACYMARTGRPGPVLVDIPDDLQRQMINTGDLKEYQPEGIAKLNHDIYKQIKKSIHLIQHAKRPVIILGWGTRLSGAEMEAKDFIEKLGIPFAPTWAMLDFMPSSHPLFVGTFGSHGTRFGNFTVQNADLIISIGARLDTREAGSPVTTFAREAKKIVVDIDKSELSKFKMLGLKPDLLINDDAKHFLGLFNKEWNQETKADIDDWFQTIQSWKERYPICSMEYYDEKETNPYVFVKALSHELSEGEIILIDTGCALAWMMQAFEPKKDQRLIHDFNNTAMGYALPGSIGASFAANKKRIICVTGDGSLQMNIQELATVIKHGLPIKIFLINNRGYNMIRQTQEQWLNGRYEASSVESGLAFPDFMKVAKAYGFKTNSIVNNQDVGRKIRRATQYQGPFFCNVHISQEHRVIPQVVFGRPNEDSEPFLNREEFLRNMIVKPHESSMKERY
jgi:acetolactate synthase I/II/III large subunit